MGLKDLKKKAEQPLDVEIAGIKFAFRELSPPENDLFEQEAREKYDAAMDDADEDSKKELKARRDEYAVWYKSWRQVVKAGDDITWDEFYGLGEMYLNEIVIAMHYKMKDAHPEYFKRLKEMEEEQSNKLLQLMQKSGVDTSKVKEALNQE